MSGIAGNVVFPEPDLGLRMAANIASRMTDATRLGDMVVLRNPMPLHDANDSGDGILLATGLLTSGEGVIVLAPDTDEVGELERRVIRCLGIDATIDDHWSFE